MAYFPNGTSGMRYEEQWCDRCIHQNGPTNDFENDMCRVWGLHLCDSDSTNKETRKMLDTLIPMDKDGVYPDKCTMFHPTGDCKGQQKLWE